MSHVQVLGLGLGGQVLSLGLAYCGLDSKSDSLYNLHQPNFLENNGEM